MPSELLSKRALSHLPPQLQLFPAASGAGVHDELDHDVVGLLAFVASSFGPYEKLKLVAPWWLENRGQGRGGRRGTVCAMEAIHKKRQMNVPGTQVAAGCCG